tara:strand:- start:480 stop:629 length:150 start_codon:yes stop_codon:yes gene_type:complete
MYEIITLFKCQEKHNELGSKEFSQWILKEIVSATTMHEQEHKKGEANAK